MPCKWTGSTGISTEGFVFCWLYQALHRSCHQYKVGVIIDNTKRFQHHILGYDWKGSSTFNKGKTAKSLFGAPSAMNAGEHHMQVAIIRMKADRFLCTMGRGIYWPTERNGIYRSMLLFKQTIYWYLLHCFSIQMETFIVWTCQINFVPPAFSSSKLNQIYTSFFCMVYKIHETFVSPSWVYSFLMNR